MRGSVASAPLTPSQGFPALAVFSDFVVGDTLSALGVRIQTDEEIVSTGVVVIVEAYLCNSPPATAAEAREGYRLLGRTNFTGSNSGIIFPAVPVLVVAGSYAFFVRDDVPLLAVLEEHTRYVAVVVTVGSGSWSGFCSLTASRE